MLLLRPIDQRTRNLLLCGPLGCMLCVVVFLVLGFTRDGYSPLKFPVSSLSLEELGWIQMVNFIVSGFLVIACSIGIYRATKLLKGAAWSATFIAAVGVGLIGAGVFTTDPVYGYPTTSPLELSQFTMQGRLHEFFSMFVFIALPIAAFRFRRRFKEAGEKGWASYSLWSGLVVLLFLVLAATGFKQVPVLVEAAGAFQRLSVITGCLWLTLLCFYLLKSRMKSAPASAAINQHECQE